MKTFMIVIFSVLAFANIAASSGSKKPKMSLRTPKVAIAVLNDASSRWTLISAMGGRLSSSDYHGMKNIGSNSGLDVRKKINMKVLNGNEFLLTDYSLRVTVSHDLRSLKVKNLTLTLNPKENFIETNDRIVRALSGTKSAAHWYRMFLMGEAEAQSVSADQSAGYDLATILYYMKVYSDSDGQLMDDFYKQDAIAKIREKSGNLKVSFKCNKNGLVATFSDGRVAYIGMNGDLMEKPKGGKATQVEGADANIVSAGRMYYCDMLSNSEDGGVDGEVSVKQMTVETPIEQ